MPVHPVKPPGVAVKEGNAPVKELLRSNDPVLLSWAEALLAGARIESVLLDTHMSILDGSISAIPRRLMVGDDDYTTARHLLRDADHNLLSDDD
jgi:hypothetical protein